MSIAVLTIGDLHQEHGEALLRQAVRMVRDPDAAEDLVQEAFVRALGHLALLQQLDRRQQRAWLAQTLKRLGLDRNAARQREAIHLAQYALEVDTVVQADTGAEADLFDLVPPQDRSLVEQRYRLGLSSTEIAAELGIPAATVRWRLRRALSRLRARRHRLP